MKYAIERRDGVAVFTVLNPKIQGEISTDFKAELLILCQPDLEAMIIDFSNVDYIDSKAIGALLLAHRQLSEHEIPLILASVNEFTRSLLSISQLEHLFTFVDKVEDALENED